jgi:hypothetical protein
MSNWPILSPSLLLRIGLFGIALWAGPSCLLSQGVSLPQPTTSNTTQPFAEFDDSLTKAADTLLVSAAQIPRPELVNTASDKTSAIGLALQDGQGLRISGDRAQSAAAVRLNLLRPAVEPILRNRGVPAELSAVILVESGGRVDALSSKGARGLWQLMPDTARRYGLHVDEIRDDRLDLFKGTDAAARYLHDLYVQFGDWKLALAAYNTGEANVASAILKAHTQEFVQLTNLRMLPRETRNYVPRVLATAQFFGHSPILEDSRGVVNATTVFAISTP